MLAKTWTCNLVEGDNLRQLRDKVTTWRAASLPPSNPSTIKSFENYLSELPKRTIPPFHLRQESPQRTYSSPTVSRNSFHHNLYHRLIHFCNSLLQNPILPLKSANRTQKSQNLLIQPLILIRQAFDLTYQTLPINTHRKPPPTAPSRPLSL